jgi:single-stranded DNA-specific DHH superfamily exonuclease
MNELSEIMDILDGDNMELKISLIQPAISMAVKKGVLPKAAPTEIYEENWEAFTQIIKEFVKNAEKTLY